MIGATRSPRRTLVLLTLLVSAAHGWLLRGAPEPLRPPQASAHRPLQTRTIAPAATTIAAAALPARTAQPLAAGLPRLHPRVAAERQPVAQPAAAASALPLAASAAVAPPSPPAAVPQAGGQPAAVAIAGSVQLHYQVTASRGRQLWQGTGQLDWRHDGNSYEAKLELSALLLPTRRQHSTGKITPEGLAPMRFSDKARSEEAAHFERDKGKVSFSSNRPDAALMAGAQDRLSVMLQLGALIAGDPHKFRPPATIVIQTAGTRDAELWHFTVEGEEQLELPGGVLNALKLSRTPRKEFDQKIELWLSPGMDYVPVRLRLTHPNGDWVDQQWSSTDRG